MCSIGHITGVDTRVEIKQQQPGTQSNAAVADPYEQSVLQLRSILSEILGSSSVSVLFLLFHGFGHHCWQLRDTAKVLHYG